MPDPLLHQAPLAGLVTVVALASLEAVLSADNAVALAGIVRQLEPPQERERVLNLGILLALPMRIAALVLASWILRFTVLRLLGGLYLLWLSLNHLLQASDPHAISASEGPRPGQRSTGAVVLQLACTDLAFSIDSISASVAITDVFPLVLLGGAMGLVLLRCLTGWLLGWMERYPKLQTAAYITILVVGVRLLMQATWPAWAPSESMLMLAIAALFLWGFSQRATLEI